MRRFAVKLRCACRVLFQNIFHLHIQITILKRKGAMKLEDLHPLYVYWWNSPIDYIKYNEGNGKENSRDQIHLKRNEDSHFEREIISCHTYELCAVSDRFRRFWNRSGWGAITWVAGVTWTDVVAWGGAVETVVLAMDAYCTWEAALPGRLRSAPLVLRTNVSIVSAFPWASSFL